MYYYEHTDGLVHQKPDRVVEMGGGPGDYFDSPFCKRWWHEDDKRPAQPPAPRGDDE